MRFPISNQSQASTYMTKTKNMLKNAWIFWYVTNICHNEKKMKYTKRRNETNKQIGFGAQIVCSTESKLRNSLPEMLQQCVFKSKKPFDQRART